jgi:hypothetical protein
MFGTGFLFGLGVILSGIMTIVSLVMGIISFAYSKKSKFIWLGGFFLSLIALVFCIISLVTKVTNKVGGFVKKMEQNMMVYPDSTSKEGYNLSDSLNSPQIKKLRIYESEELKGQVPDQFYTYLGFRDYYRLPLPYPFSIHCTETPGVGDLFDERNVKKFDANDNGEKECLLKNIAEFAFDANYILAKCVHNQGKDAEFKFFIYDLKTEKAEEFSNAVQMNRRAAELKFSGDKKLISCEAYFQKF